MSAAARPQAQEQSAAKRFTRIISDNRVGLLIMITVLFVTIGSLKPMFYSTDFVIAPMLTNIAIFTVIGLAQMMALSVGQMNLAVGGMASAGALATGIVLQRFDAPLVVGIIAGVIAGSLLGALCGLLIARAGVNAFVVTFAMNFALLGLVPTVYSWASPDAAISVDTPGLAELGRQTLDQVCIGAMCGPKGVPVLLLISIVAMILIGALYSRMRVGREILLTGSNDQAALLSGIPVARRLITVHMISGALAALAGIMLGASTGSFTPAIGQDFMLQSFLGPILGGTLLTGGAVSVLGTMLGITLTVVIRQGLLIFQVGVEWLNILLGLILLIALSSDRIRTVVGQRNALRQTLAKPQPPGPGAPPSDAAAAQMESTR
ncbi:ABC transporter permease [Leucobacter sp. M11]|uniref:ABC transporter permease n=1 Tax=Leucobacter sp. M11 TaxID=2993565 RepID=UPI002D7E444A|nr:ABC transporter permease [Leucobacter sp. M11]MEB4615115.1 ABC transporter permease [Leucobacter sp. M11]